MNNSKIKNLFLIILIAQNIFLLVVIGADRIKDRALYEESMAGVVSIMASRGLSVSEDADLSDAQLNVYSVSRDLDAEEKHISSVLGKTSVQDQGGNIIFYQGESGQAEFSGTGNFEILMNEGAVPVGSDAEDTARAYLNKLGISAEKGKGSAKVDVNDGSGTVVLNCRVGKTEIINCKVTFTFTNGSLLLIVGTRPLDEISADVSGDALEISTVLMRFLDIINKGGHVCSELKSTELCYMQSASVSGAGTLVPVWRLETDAGNFYINGLTGEQETVN